MCGQASNHNGEAYYCKRCFHGYSTQARLDTHSIHCAHPQRVGFHEDPKCFFSNIQKQLQAPFEVYADFESVLEALGDVDTTQGVSLGEESSTTPYQEHVACSFAYKIVSSVLQDVNKPIVYYRGEDAAGEFVHLL